VRSDLEAGLTVARILKEKGQQVLTARPDATLRDVVAVLAQKKIGALVVSDDSKVPLGIISERDVIRALGATGGGALDDPVSRHMTERVITVGMDATIDEVMEIMNKGHFRHMPVVEDSKLAGIVSVSDIVKRHVDALHSEHQALRQYIGGAVS
jgi:CBS domain-containing protein